MMFLVPRTCTETAPDDEDRSQQTDPRSLLEFRSTPAYVLLGDPGSGKSTEFEHECEALGNEAVFITAQDFLTFQVNSRPSWQGRTLFIDGLDEIRAGSLDARTPFHEIRRRLDDLGRPQFRISCREADWLGDYDLRHLASVSRNSQVVTLRLDPLTESDVSDILTARRELPQRRQSKTRGVDKLYPVQLRLSSRESSLSKAIVRIG